LALFVYARKLFIGGNSNPPRRCLEEIETPFPTREHWYHISPTAINIVLEIGMPEYPQRGVAVVQWQISDGTFHFEAGAHVRHVQDRTIDRRPAAFKGVRALLSARRRRRASFRRSCFGLSIVRPSGHTRPSALPVVVIAVALRGEVFRHGG
jgi:hypothetical protein